MPSTTKVPLGASTLNRKWQIDVNTGTFAAPVWTGVFGVQEFKPTKSPTLQDSSDFDSEGWKNSTATALDGGAELKVRRAPTAASPTAYDPGQEVLRIASDGLGTANSVDIRYYEVTPGGPKVEAYRQSVVVTWEPDGGDMAALDTVSVKLAGQGKRTSITHPDSAAVAVPTITLVDPATAGIAGGALIIVTGTDFVGATAVIVDATTLNVADWEVVSNTRFAVKVPAHIAGVVDIKITTPGGTSATSASTKITYS